MDVIIEVILELFFEVFFNGIIPAVIPDYRDKRRVRIEKGIIAIVVYLIIFISSLLCLIFNHNNIKFILVFIGLIVISTILIIASILRVKCYKLSIIYKLNFICLAWSFITMIVEIVLLSTATKMSTGVICGIILTGVGILLLMVITIVTVCIVKKSIKAEGEVFKLIEKYNHSDKDIYAINKYSLCVKYGYLYYFGQIGDIDEEIKYLKDVISKKLIERLKYLYELYNNNVLCDLKKYDNEIKKYSKKIERYKYRLVYSRYYSSLIEGK